MRSNVRLRAAVSAAIWLLLLSPRNTPAQTADGDPFIATIAAMKRTVAPIACVENTDAGARRPGRVAGTAFFLTPAGEFLTAAHVVSDILHGALTGGPLGCASPVVYLPATEWPTGSNEFTARWYAFDSKRCVLDTTLDLALCATRSSPSEDLKRTIGTVTFDTSPHADGTAVAFTGFPLNALQPMTARGHIAMYSARDELIVDQSAWPGVSGCPVYLADGRVVGMLIQRGTGEGTGRSFVRTSAAIEQFVAAAREKRKK
jgi:V8-like Glu-specific endopeptidase